MEEILRGNGSLESGNMQDLTFCGVEVHVPVLMHRKLGRLEEYYGKILDILENISTQ